MSRYVKFFDTLDKEITLSKEIKASKEIFHLIIGTSGECAVILTRAQAEILLSALDDALEPM